MECGLQSGGWALIQSVDLGTEFGPKWTSVWSVDFCLECGLQFGVWTSVWRLECGFQFGVWTSDPNVNLSGPRSRVWTSIQSVNLSAELGLQSGEWTTVWSVGLSP